MILINKGGAPAELTGNGAAFQIAALAFARGQGYDQAYKNDFEKYLKLSVKDGNGTHATLPSDVPGQNFPAGFGGFSSGLFSAFNHYSHHTVKNSLVQSHHGKCAYCEAQIRHVVVGDVEHVAPKAEVTVLDLDAAGSKSIARHTGFFWLSQTWDNLVLACNECNQTFKRSRFDLAGDGPVLINPSDPGLNPRDVFVFNVQSAQIETKAGGPGDANRNRGRAMRTIEILGLNRPRLVQKRAAHLLKLRALFVTALRDGALAAWKPLHVLELIYETNNAGMDAQSALRQATQPWSEFSALAMDALEAWSQEIELAPVQFVISQQNQNQARVVTARPRLEPWVTLERTTAQAASQDSPEPDTAAIDDEYNGALSEYKALVNDYDAFLGASKADQQKAIENDAFADNYFVALNLARNMIFRIDRAQAAERWSQGKGQDGDGELVATFGPISDNDKWAEVRGVWEKAGDFNKHIQSIKPMRQELRNRRNANNLSVSRLRNKADDIEESARIVLADYQQIGADVDSRCKRTVELIEAVRALGEHIKTSPLAVPSGGAIAHHVRDKKKFPSAIRT